MSQHDDSHQSEAAPRDDARSRRNEHHANVYQPKEIDIYVTPGARYRKRADGGLDESFRIQFVNVLTERHMSAIARFLIAMPEEAAEYGYTALTKLEFLEPDVCDYRFWCAHFHSDRLVATWGLWQRIHRDVCPIYSIDGVRYSAMFKSDKNS